jgi:hypothetical protein
VSQAPDGLVAAGYDQGMVDYGLEGTDNVVIVVDNDVKITDDGVKIIDNPVKVIDYAVKIIDNA